MPHRHNLRGAAPYGGTPPTKLLLMLRRLGSNSEDLEIQNIIPDERTNSMIIIATERAYLRLIEMIRYLDTPLEGEGQVHVHNVQHGAAADIAEALTALIGTSGARRSSGPGGPPPSKKNN